MRGFKIQRVRAAVTSILTGDKGSDFRPFAGRYVHKAMVGGAKMAPMMPIYALVIWA